MSLPAHVLLVDDDPQVREVVTKLLLRIVEEVTAVENGRKAVHSFSDRLPDLVLADVIMPGMSGCNLTQRIVDVEPKARVILMSGDERALEEIEVLTTGVGAIGYLPKPFSLESLKEILEDAMEGEARESEAIPASYSLSESILEVTLEGRFTVEETLAAFALGLTSIPSGAKYGVLIDVTRSEELFGLKELRQVAELLGGHRDSLGGRIAVLVADAARFGVTRQFGAVVERHSLEAVPFGHRDAAVSWLAAGR